MSDSFASQYLEETRRIAAAVDPERVEALAAALAQVRARGGRLFFLGVGGGVHLTPRLIFAPAQLISTTRPSS